MSKLDKIKAALLEGPIYLTADAAEDIAEYLIDEGFVVSDPRDAEIARLTERAEKAEADCEHWANDYKDQGNRLNALAEKLRVAADALAAADSGFESIRNRLSNHLAQPELGAFWTAINMIRMVRFALAFIQKDVDANV